MVNESSGFKPLRLYCIAYAYLKVQQYNKKNPTKPYRQKLFLIN